MNKYDYNYKEDIYHEKDSKKNSESTVDVTASASDASEESAYHIDIFYVCTVNTYSCCMCQTAFKSNNKLHQHVHTTHTNKKKAVILDTDAVKFLSLLSEFNFNIVKSDAFNCIDELRCRFQNWHYITLAVQFMFSDFTEMICLDTDCIMSLINREFLQQHQFNLTVQKLTDKITVHSIESKTHKCQKYVCLSLYLSDMLSEKLTVAYITCNIHLINNLWANILISMNIIELEWINTDISLLRTILEECKNMLLNLQITFWHS